MGKVIKSDGTTVELLPKNGTDYTLDEMQEVVGGLIEIIPCFDETKVMVINEEGKLLGLPYNEKATLLAKIAWWDSIVGDVLICDNNEIK